MKLSRWIGPSRRRARVQRAARSGAGVLTAAAAALAGCASVPAELAPALRVESVLRVADGVPGGNYEGALALARRYAGEARWAQAAEAYRRAVSIDGRDAQVQNELGHAEAVLQRHPAAIAAFERAVAQAPDRVDVLNNLGYALLLAGQPAKAADVLASAVRRAPSYAVARANLELADQQLAEARARSPEVVATGEAHAELPALIDVGRMAAFDRPAAEAATVAPLTVAGRAPMPRLHWAQADRQVLQLRMDTDAAAAPGAAQATAAAADAGLASALPPPRLKLEVSNGAGRTGLARATALALRSAGQPTQRITNHAHFRVAKTQIQYRAAHDLAEAGELARRFAMPVVLVLNPRLSPDIGLRVLLGRDAAVLAAQALPLTQAA